MRARFLFAFLLVIFFCSVANAQESTCSLSIKGHVSLLHDTTNNLARAASVYIPEMKKTILTDRAGNFGIDGICPGKVRLKITYLGYRTVDTTLNVDDNVIVNFPLTSLAKELDEVIVRSDAIHKDQITTAVKTIFTGKELDETRGLSLGESLKKITGLNSIQSGPSVSKPVIHGLYGNRILIMNNGVRQEGQTWGNDHAPEIDPFIATNITVIKGAASIRYGSDAIGGVILLDPKAMPKIPGIDGEVNVVGMTNGQTGVASGMIEGAFRDKLQGLSWRLQGTVKQAGNAQTSDYYLANTAFKENDYSAALNYTKKGYGGELYYSRFNSKIDIALASVTGSETDFIAASKFTRPDTTGGFSNDINRPYQTVNHQLIKASGFLNLPHNLGKLEGVYAYQQDIRQEYDFDPSYNSNNSNTANIPDLNFKLHTTTINMIWEHPSIKHKIEGSIGLDFITHGNIEQGTSYQQLIPNFEDYGGGIFAIEKIHIHKWTLEAGYRYDYRWLQAYLYNGNTVIEERPTYNWQNSTINIGGDYHLNDKFSATFNFGSAWRPPQVIELFADGIHQSAASWQIGDPNLKLEKAYNTSAAINYNTVDFQAELGLYVNYFQNYIYAKPDSSGVQTLNGYFPAFTYTQAKDALFEGIDFSFKYDFWKHFSLNSKTSVVRARDLDLHQWLIGIPSDRFDNNIRYTWKKLGKMKDVYIGINNLVSSKQTRLPPFLPSGTADAKVYNILVNSPDGYTLWGAEAGCSVKWGHQYIDMSLSVTNLTNVAYRDYLDEFRYYVNDLGRNIVLRIKIPFDFIKSGN